MNSGGIFDIEAKSKRLQELETAVQNPHVWNDHQEMQKINREKVILEKAVEDWKKLHTGVEDAEILMDLVVEEKDEKGFQDLKDELIKMETQLAELELKSLLSGKMDSHSAYVSINSGAGGTEACDWAQMLFRMFLRYCERQEWKTEILAMTEGDEAGLKSVTFLVEGPFAYGYLKAENGVHRLVRISPFDSNARRHTSFASVTSWPEVDDDIDIQVRDEDLRIDTYRASGAGGQHVNKTDSAVRITHVPTGIVVQCQSQRSQHANRDKAMKMLKAALYEKEEEKRKAEQDEISGEKKAIEWGSQIRSYVLHPYQMVKDHRTGQESGNPAAVLDGHLDEFIESYLKFQARGE